MFTTRSNRRPRLRLCLTVSAAGGGWGERERKAPSKSTQRFGDVKCARNGVLVGFFGSGGSRQEKKPEPRRTGHVRPGITRQQQERALELIPEREGTESVKMGGGTGVKMARESWHHRVGPRVGCERPPDERGCVVCMQWHRLS